MKYFKSNKYQIELVLSTNNKNNYENHNHTGHYVIILPISGKATANIKNQNIDFCNNKTIIIPPYVSHSISQQTTTTFLSLCIGIQLIKSYQLPIAKKIIRKFLDVCYDKKIVNYIQKEIFLNSIQKIYNQDYQKEFDIQIRELVIEFINQPENNKNLNVFSKEIHISKYYLLRKFKNNVGMTPHKFHIQCKIRKAQRLLDNEKRIIDISNEMGFYDQSHFDKSFRKIVGISPFEYISSVENLD